MILFLSKLVPTVLYPLGLAILLALFALIFGRFRRTARAALLLAIVLLWLPAMPATAHLLALRWEAAYPPAAVADLPKAGIDVAAATAAVEGSYPVFSSPLDFPPNAGALAATSDTVTKMIGMVYYRLRGWA